MDNSYWDRYLGGSVDAISQDAKQGALLFYGQAGCANCHSGPLLTDQEQHVLAAPQVGPGKGELAPLDVGRMQVTSVEADKFAFRTPPLHNVVLSGPWMHDGAYNTLEAVVAHHLDPASSLLQYDPDVHLPAPVRETYQFDEEISRQMLANIDQLLAEAIDLSD
jgi:cytochrome c peroxidase